MTQQETERRQSRVGRRTAVKKKPVRRFPNGLVIDPRFLSRRTWPIRSRPCEWEIRTAAIKGEDGEVLFEQNDCEVPTAGASWPRTSCAASISMARGHAASARTASGS